VKYSGEVKEVGVTVRLETGDGARPVIAVAVRDHGIGIAPAEQPKIFGAFYRVEKGLEHDVKGSGLGLVVVQHIAEAHGGTVRVESRPGVGSTFTLRLPVRCAGDGPAADGGTATGTDRAAGAGTATPKESTS
jgi:two-component system sensor histidine kinase SenX3